jgi:coenzyme F420-reducing hydrogenase beta subunit
MDLFKNVIEKDLCIGCGACVGQDRLGNLKMELNDFGFLVPKRESLFKDVDSSAIKVCPFNPSPENEVRTENELADLFLTNVPNFHPKIGKYYDTYVGYSNEFRLTSSSGGLASYITKKLLMKGIVDVVYVVKETMSENYHYEYTPIISPNEVLSSSETKYYPVTLSNFFKELSTINGKVAVVGVACFIKAIRLFQHYNPEIKDKVTFLIGIICGGVKSSFFAEYLSAKTGIDNNNFTNPQFRIKDLSSTASDYSYRCKDLRGNYHSIKMSSVGDMWGTGIFKNNACDFCDDVTTELADISLGDAWLKPYIKDGRGTNVIVTRSQIADELIKSGIASKELSVEQLTLDAFLSSQQGSFNHRHNALGYRIKKAENYDRKIPPKRHNKEKISFDFKYVQDKRMKIRMNSLLLWQKTKSAENFDNEISKDLTNLKRLTKIYHYCRAFKNKLLKL